MRRRRTTGLVPGDRKPALRTGYGIAALANSPAKRSNSASSATSHPGGVIPKAVSSRVRSSRELAGRRAGVAQARAELLQVEANGKERRQHVETVEEELQQHVLRLSGASLRRDTIHVWGVRAKQVTAFHF